MVYHYTTIESFYNMLASYKASEDKEHFVFWASSALCQNDRAELFLKYEDLIDVVKEVEDEKKKSEQINRNILLSRVTEEGLIIDKYQDDIIKEINRVNVDYTPYTLSFSQNEDSLLMWSLYAHNGTGLCLAFDESKIKPLEKGLFVIRDSVIYGNNKEKYKDAVAAVYNKYIGKVKGLVVQNEILSEKIITWESLLWGIAPFVKNEGFQDEAEWRIVFYKDNSDHTKTYKRLTGHLNEVSYVKVNIPLEALHHIVIGPCADFNRVRSLLVDNMRSCNIDKDYDKDFLKPSMVPYRMY